MRTRSSFDVSCVSNPPAFVIVRDRVAMGSSDARLLDFSIALPFASSSSTYTPGSAISFSTLWLSWSGDSLSAAPVALVSDVICRARTLSESSIDAYRRDEIRK
jgi:hypothetical protein